MDLARITVCLNDYIVQFDYNSTIMNTKVDLYNTFRSPTSLVVEAPMLALSSLKCTTGSMLVGLRLMPRLLIEPASAWVNALLSSEKAHLSMLRKMIQVHSIQTLFGRCAHRSKNEAKHTCTVPSLDRPSILGRLPAVAVA